MLVLTLYRRWQNKRTAKAIRRALGLSSSMALQTVSSHSGGADLAWRGMGARCLDWSTLQTCIDSPWPYCPLDLSTAMNNSFSFPLAPEFKFWFGSMRLDTFFIFCNPFIYLWGWHFLLRENIGKQHAGTTFSKTFNYWKTFCLSLDFTQRGGAIYFQTTLLGFNLNFEGNYFGYYFSYIFPQILIKSPQLG